MRHFAETPFIFLAAGLLALPLGAEPSGAGMPAADEIVFIDLSQLATPPHQVTMTRAPLPDGPVSDPVQVLGAPLRTFATPSGQLLAFSHLSFPERNILYELKVDGTMREIATITAGYDSSLDAIRGLAGDGRGRLYLLHGNVAGDPAHPENGLYEIDPATGHLGKPVALPAGVRTIASAAAGLWAINGDGFLQSLDPDSGALGPLVGSLDGNGTATEIDSDSAGNIYFRRPCLMPLMCSRLSIYDPASGTFTDAPPELQYALRESEDFAIVRGGEAPPAAVYLNNGRFRVEIDYRGYDGAAGRARPAPARSRDTGIFYFFDEDNWELMVKALNGCHLNEHFWVYAAASTDVGYVMTITDTVTGAKKIYSNALGHVAETVTDGMAFSCEP